MCACLRVCVCACVRACARVCVRVCVRACVRVRSTNTPVLGVAANCIMAHTAQIS